MKKVLSTVVTAMLVLTVVAVVGLGRYLSSGKTLQPWHTPSTIAESFDYENGTFADYIAWHERRVRAGRTDNAPDSVINNILPFELMPEADCPVNPDGRYPNGIVLTHGLIASPWSMRHVGEYFQSHCFYVLGVLLSGHGTRPGDMLVSTWQDWQQDVHFATNLVAARADRVFLSGHSAGGTLSVLEASRNPVVDALILFAPAMAIDPASAYAGMVSQMGKLFPAAAWFEVEPDDGVYRYESFPFNAAAQTWELIEATRASLAEKALIIPVLTIASAQDTTVLAQATFDFMQAQDNPLSFTVLYSQNRLPPYHRTRMVNSNDPANGILGMGHLGLMTPPDHPDYGRDGAYRYCGQYYGDGTDGFDRCKAGQRDFYGEATPENRELGLIERIAFNPFYDDMLAEISLFLEQISMDTRGLPLEPELPGDGLPD